MEPFWHEIVNGGFEVATDVIAIHPSQEIKLLGSEKPYEYERSQYTHELSSKVARGS